MPRRGVRYYRCLPPPQDEWPDDYKAMADAGLDFVVVPAPWCLCHDEADVFHLEPLVRQLDLAATHGLALVAAVDLTTAPTWLVVRHPACLHEDAAGARVAPRALPGAPSGGWPGLCLDNGNVRGPAGRFLRGLATTLAHHPALGGYDLSAFSAMEALVAAEPQALYCQCAGSRARFVAWLRRTYGDHLAALERAWGRRFSRWADVAPPAALGQFPDVLEWRRFQAEGAAAHLRWCVEAVREADRDAPVVAAAAPPGSAALADAAQLAPEVSEIGCRLPHDAWPHELVDRASHTVPGKPLWLTDIATDDADHLRKTHWSSLAAPPDALVYAGWRPERVAAASARTLATPRGEPSERVQAIRWAADLLDNHPDLASARPAPPEVAIVVVPEARLFWSAHTRAPHPYEQALAGAYHAFAGRGARVEFAPPDALAAFPLAYLPLALAMDDATAAALRRYVESGGHLVAEACSARYDVLGWSRRESPGAGLSEVFGARAIDAPALVGPEPVPTFRGRRGSYPCCLHCEPLEATTGSAKARFPDGAAAIVDHAFGEGTARLIATHPSLGYGGDHNKSHARVILDSLAFARVRPQVTTSAPTVCVRLLEGDDARFLCAFNLTDKPQETTLRIARSLGHFRRAIDLATGRARRLRDNARRVKIKPADGLVLRLEPAPPHQRWRANRKASSR